jgi:hypothetical protein
MVTENPLIDRNYALLQLKIGELEHGGVFETDSDHVKDFLLSLPSVDVVEAVRGKWIEDDDSVYCSICGFKISPYIPYICDGEKFLPLYANKYCGNCGAKMDGGQDEK